MLDNLSKTTRLRQITSRIDWVALLSIAVIVLFAGVLITCYFFPIYPDEIQVRFWLSRLPYDFPMKISGAPTCVSNFTQPVPVTMYLPGLLDWALHGNFESFHTLRQIGLIIPLFWTTGLAFYLRNMVRKSLTHEGCARDSWRFLHLVGLFVAVFSIGVFPVFLITNRGEQLMLPSVALLIFIFLISQRLKRKGQSWQKWGLTGLYFVAVSLTLYGHPKGLFLTPFFIIVGWQLFRQFNNQVLFVFFMMLLGFHILQDYIALKYAFQCNEVPKLAAMLKSFSLDPFALFYDPHSFFTQALQSLINCKKYLYQLSFQSSTDVNYLPALTLGPLEKFVNFFIRLNLIIAFFTVLVILPFRYYWVDVARGRVVTINGVLLILFFCLLGSAIFNLPKNWYDAGYFFAVFLIILIFFVGENFNIIFQQPSVRIMYIYLAIIALLSQGVFIHHYLPAFWNGFAGPGIPIVSYNYSKASNEIATAASDCDIDSVNGKKVIVDDYTYPYFHKSRQPMAITYIFLGNDAESSRRFISEVDSGGLIARCSSIPVPYIPFVKRTETICCVSKSDLKKLPRPF